MSAGNSGRFSVLGAATLLGLLIASPVAADSRKTVIPAAPEPTYADLADLADAAPLVIQVQPRKVLKVAPERARGVPPGWGRLYVEAKTTALVSGRTGVGAKLRYLVDVPLDAKGKPPRLLKQQHVIFARDVPGRPDELQLVAPDGQLPWDARLDSRLRGVIGELAAPGAPQRVTALREAIHVPGTLANEGETQLFLETAGQEPAAITVTRVPGQPARWTASFSELVSSSAGPPRRDTLAWYRLACFLPRQLPGGVNNSGTVEDRQAAARDYRYVIEQLGACPRNRGRQG